MTKRTSWPGSRPFDLERAPLSFSPATAIRHRQTLAGVSSVPKSGPTFRNCQRGPLTRKSRVVPTRYAQGREAPAKAAIPVENCGRRHRVVRNFNLQWKGSSGPAASELPSAERANHRPPTSKNRAYGPCAKWSCNSSKFCTVWSSARVSWR